SSGPFQWFGFPDPHRWRRDWEQNGILGPDGGLGVEDDLLRPDLTTGRAAPSSGEHGSSVGGRRGGTGRRAGTRRAANSPQRHGIPLCHE
ncbi:hypothetical protein ACWERV_05075, partial [Streptomyces sp. NPDC004031]